MGSWTLFLGAQRINYRARVSYSRLHCRPASFTLLSTHPSPKYCPSRLLPTPPAVTIRRGKCLESRWSHHPMFAHTGIWECGAHTLHLGGPPHVKPCDKEESDGELLNFLSALFNLEPKEFSLQNKFLTCQLTLGARKQIQQHPKPVASSWACVTWGIYQDRTEPLAIFQAHLAWG